MYGPSSRDRFKSDTLKCPRTADDSEGKKDSLINNLIFHASCLRKKLSDICKRASIGVHSSRLKDSYEGALNPCDLYIGICVLMQK